MSNMTSEEYVAGIDHILDDYYSKDDKNFMPAEEYFEYMIRNPELFSLYEINPILVPEAINTNLANNTYTRIPKSTDKEESFIIPDIFKSLGTGYRIGCDYKGIKDIKEKENSNIFIPSSNYCFAKCLMKFYDIKKINRSSKFSDFKLLSPHSISLKKIRLEIISKIVTCKFNCPKGNETNPCKTCSKECKQDKKERFSKISFPQIFKVWYDRKSNKVKRYIISKEKIIQNQPFIGLVYIGGNEYHAVLCKNNKLTKEDITIYFEQNTSLVVNTTRLSESIIPKLGDFVVSYDIETYVEEKMEPKYKNKNCTETELRKNLVPYALGYRVINLTTKEFVSDYKEIIIENKKDNLFNKFFDELEQLPYEDLQVFAHNGGKFDNLFARTATNVTFKTSIAKGNTLKQLTVIKNKKEFKFKDSLPFVLQSLKEACSTFRTEIKKLDFDIVDKTYEWYEKYKNTTRPEKNWRQYLQNDVDSLADLLIKVESKFKELGLSIRQACGLPGLAFYAMNTYCLGMRKLVVPKDPTLIKFFREGMYGGRVIQWKRKYECKDKHGMIAIDYNSLYSSAMYLFSYPINAPILFTEDELKDFNFINNKKHYYINATIKIPNIRYAYHPYKTEDGNLIYPSNCVIKGVYNDVDLREMIKDGYEVLSVDKGVYWVQSAKIFDKFIFQYYNTRNYYKKLGEDHPEYPMEYIIKILLNACYGKFNETIRTYTKIYNENVDIIPDFNGKEVNYYQFPNGQKEVTIGLNKLEVRKPSYIASYILAYARSIVNEVIRVVKPENIYYSDTDSLYIEKRILIENNLPCSSDLGGFKNDYGEGTKIVNAIFLDNKRYFLELTKEENGEIKRSYKAKFNGLAFKKFKTISDNASIHIDQFSKDTPIDEQINQVRGLYEKLLENYNKKIQSPYFQINYAKTLSLEESKNKNREKYLENDKKHRLWMKENINDLKVVTDFWTKSKCQVYISEKIINFQIDPHKRGQWIMDDYYAIGFDTCKPEFNSLFKGEINGMKNSHKDAISYTHKLYFENNALHIKSQRPLIFSNETKMVGAPDKLLLNNEKNLSIIKTKFYYNEQTETVFIKISDNEMCEVNGFGMINKQPLNLENLNPLVMIKGTEINKKKYGENTIEDFSVRDIFNNINKAISLNK